ncbi:hypothetical protein [Bradyrhizobium retamae]|uniref:hypothetical protein n=1 Tax=Bradyrhizobium retamae TaxID=1300035 RepID=UPI0012E3F99A|nr:hypothetical protein [Bradyrhizobium retamae]
MADRYVDFCRLSAGALPLRVSIPLAAHALRELESVLRQTLAGPMKIAADVTPDDLAKVEATRKHLHAAGFNDDQSRRQGTAAAVESQGTDSSDRRASRIGSRWRYRARLDCDFASTRQGAWSRSLSVAGGRCRISRPMAGASRFCTALSRAACAFDRLLASLTFLAAAASSRRRSTSRRFGSLFSSATAVRAALSLIVGAIRFFGLSPRSRPASS